MKGGGMKGGGMKMIVPGIYDDGESTLHIISEHIISEMLAHHGFANTPLNRQAMVETAQEALEEMTGKPLSMQFTHEPLPRKEVGP